MPTEKTFDTSTIKINYAEGPANGTPLVMFYSATARGHGKSAWRASYRVVTTTSNVPEFTTGIYQTFGFGIPQTKKLMAKRIYTDINGFPYVLQECP